MTGNSLPTTYEKAVSTGLLVVIAWAGWGALTLLAWRLPYVERPFLFVSLAMAVMSLGLIYDAAERLAGTGKGLYAAAIFCSMPAFGLTLTDPGALADTGLVMMSSLTIWLGARITGDERPHFLGMLAALLITGGYFFGLRSGSSLVMIFGAMLAARNGRAVLQTAILLCAAYGIGLILHQMPGLTLPDFHVSPAIGKAEALRSTVIFLPWTTLALTQILRLITTTGARWQWQSDAAVTILVVIVICSLSGAVMLGAGAAVTPLIAVMGTSVVGEWFASQAKMTERGRLRAALVSLGIAPLAGLFTGMLGLFGSRKKSSEDEQDSGRKRAPALVVLVGLMLLSATLKSLLSVLQNVGDWANQQASREPQARFWLPVWLSILALITLTTLGLIRSSFAQPMGMFRLAAAVVLIGGLVVALKQELPRASFVFLFCSAVFLGIESSSRFAEVSSAAVSSKPEIPWIWLAAVSLLIMFAGISGFRHFFGYPAPRAARVREQEFRYGEGKFMIFLPVRGQWSGEPVEPQLACQETFRFAVFGDVTGAESPISSRRGTHRVFRELTRALAVLNVNFGVALGDLASSATPLAYRRMRVLLSRVFLPIIVTPGNHDLFDRNQYNAALFHSLFGPDNTVFRCGPLKCVILNNAWGSVVEEQFQWLESVLNEQPAPFTFVFCHKPPFDFRAGVFYGMEDRDDAARLHNLFRDYRVSAVFSGHIHALFSEVREGVHYVISGGGGSRLVEGDAVHHFLLAEVSANEIVVRAHPLLTKSAESDQPLLELRFLPRA